MGWYKVLFCCLYTSVEDMEKILECIYYGRDVIF